MKIVDRFDGFDGRICITDENGEKRFGDNYDYGLSDMTHVTPVDKITIITGENCSKCRSLKKMISAEGLDKFVQYEDVNAIMLSADSGMTSIPIMKCGLLMTCDYEEIFRFFRWLKSRT